MTEGYRVRRMEAADLPIALDWAAAEGWNPGLHDAEAFFAADANGFFIGELNGKPAACISAVAYDSTFGFLGFYIVHPDLRGRGYGLKIWQEAMSYLGERNAGLDGVPAQQANYARSGFEVAHRNVRFLGKPVAVDGGWEVGVIDATNIPFTQLSAFDRRFFPAARDSFLRRWITAAGTHAVAVMAYGEIEGFGVVRPCRSGYKIGPLFAANAQMAERIFSALIARLPKGSEVSLDVPEPNQDAVRLAERHGLSPSFETARMYSKTEPGLPLTRIFGVTSFELG